MCHWLQSTSQINFHASIGDADAGLCQAAKRFGGQENGVVFNMETYLSCNPGSNLSESTGE